MQGSYLDVHAGKHALSQCVLAQSDTRAVYLQVRHGAALGLREILRSQAASAGLHAPVSAQPSGIVFWFLSCCMDRPIPVLYRGVQQTQWQELNMLPSVLSLLLHDG